MKEVKVLYNKITRVVAIDAKASDFNEKYLQYVLTYHKIPVDAKIVFTEDQHR